MRYFLTLAYCGTRYAGWQRQPNATGVQETLEQAISTVLRQPVELTGCGRTDAGVHARHYVAHIDADGKLPFTWLNSLNSLLPEDIAVHRAVPVSSGAHARFDAIERSYTYFMTFQKDPFSVETAWFYPRGHRLDMANMYAVAAIIARFESFFPFCKSHSGVDHYGCSITRCQWVPTLDGTGLAFHISANRFLRGMVRLIVGACIQAGRGQIDPDDVHAALEQQKPLKKSLSAPPHGLALTDVKYPYPV